MSEDTTHSKFGAVIAAPFLVFSFLLLALLIPDVVLRKPIMPPKVREKWVMHHQVAQNFIFAQRMVDSRLDSPTAFWSPISRCGEAGRGVWFAEGSVTSVRAQGPVSWKILFIPGDSEPLYIRVGSHEEGDYTAALVRAGLQPGTP